MLQTIDTLEWQYTSLTDLAEENPNIAKQFSMWCL